MKISFLGPIGTFSYSACEKYLQEKNLKAEKVPFKSITQAIQALISKEVNYCIVPIENSIQGSVFETIDTLLSNQNLFIKDEYILPVEHHLMANCEKANISKIFSHPQALAQCRNYLIENFPNIDIEETTSTAIAAKYVETHSNFACISNISCSKLYGLNIIDKNIQDNRDNQTRFIVLSLSPENKTIFNKTSIYFSTLNKPGELYRILGLFNIFDVNLTKIESRPAKTSLGEYVFWIDFENDNSNKSIPILLEQIEKLCSYFRILGTY